MPTIDVACPKCHEKTVADMGDTPPGKQPVIKCRTCFHKNPLATWIKEREKQAAALVKDQQEAQKAAAKAREEEATAKRHERERDVRNVTNDRLARERADAAKDRADAQADAAFARAKELASRTGTGCQRCGSTNLEQRTRYTNGLWARLVFAAALGITFFGTLGPMGGNAGFVSTGLFALSVAFLLTAFMQTEKIGVCRNCGWKWRT